MNERASESTHWYSTIVVLIICGLLLDIWTFSKEMHMIHYPWIHPIDPFRVWSSTLAVILSKSESQRLATLT